jgi:hypothetical protein
MVTPGCPCAPTASDAAVFDSMRPSAAEGTHTWSAEGDSSGNLPPLVLANVDGRPLGQSQKEDTHGVTSRSEENSKLFPSLPKEEWMELVDGPRSTRAVGAAGIFQTGFFWA